VEKVALIEVNSLSYWYPEMERPALDRIDLKIEEGEFVLIVGPSGCGKSTLLRLFNRTVPDYYGGRIGGNVFIDGKNITEYGKKEIIKKAGIVYQHPEKQIVMQDVEREIAFGLENLNVNIEKMKRNVAEVVSFLNLNHIKDRSTSEISGGEKQRIAIGSVIAMDPDIMMFDEPTSQLDPIGAEEVLSFIKKLNRDTGKTIILVEQRLDRCFDMADRIIFMEKGKISGEGTPSNIPDNINKKYFMPGLTHLFKEAGFENPPVNVKQARDLIRNIDIKVPEVRERVHKDEVMRVSKINFEYEKGSRVLKNINFALRRGEILAVMGENGAGKSTLFKIIAGLIDNYSGEIGVNGKEIRKMNMAERIETIGYLSQNPNDYLGRETVFDEVAYTLKNIGSYDSHRVEKIIEQLGLSEVRNKNPRDLSGGEKQRVAIACTMVTEPDILVLDEPTRGLDSVNKDKLGEMLKRLSDEGRTIVLITHDSDFAADYTDNVMMMFNGEIVANGRTEELLYDAIYYSPQIAKVFKNKCRIVRTEDALNCLR
jgi:energy-coupling factor transport system ATP-binding protein